LNNFDVDRRTDENGDLVLGYGHEALLELEKANEEAKNRYLENRVGSQEYDEPLESDLYL